MSEETPQKHRELAVMIVDQASPKERSALQMWAEGLLEINDRPVGNFQKTKEAFELTRRSKVVLPLLQIVGREIKKHGWDRRSKNARVGLVAAAASLIVFGTQGAGIAALGTAIGVPLWVIFGAGAMFLSTLIDEIRTKQK